MSKVLRGAMIYGGPHDGMEVALDPEKWADDWPVVITLDNENGVGTYRGADPLPTQERDGVVILSRLYLWNDYQYNVPNELLK